MQTIWTTQQITAKILPSKSQRAIFIGEQRINSNKSKNYTYTTLIFKYKKVNLQPSLENTAAAKQHYSTVSSDK